VKADVVIGAIDGYGWSQVRNWALSLQAAGFAGRRVVVAYRIDDDTRRRLERAGVEVTQATHDHLGTRIDYDAWRRSALPGRIRRLARVAVAKDARYIGQNRVFQMRFFHIWKHLATLDSSDYRYVIATDVGDVVFQSNPSIWLEQHLGDKRVVASSESLLHQDEPWGRESTSKCFGPDIWDAVRAQPILNAGVIAGDLEFARDLFLQVYLATYSSVHNNSDQAAYNVLLNCKTHSPQVLLARSDDGWACQAGTVADPAKIDMFRGKLLDPEPTFRDGFACTSQGSKYCILHQYNRVPAWKAEIDDVYRRMDERD
jgi:hypothetical protein